MLRRSTITSNGKTRQVNMATSDMKLRESAEEAASMD